MSTNKTQTSKPQEYIFSRKEIKYRIPADKKELFLRRMDELIMPEPNYPTSNILSIYYDTDSNDLVSRSIAKPPYKEKLRIRSYGVPDRKSIVFPELKKKYKGIVYKRRAAMPLNRAEAFLNAGIMPEKEFQIIKELAYVRDFYQPKPKIFVAYDRVSYVGRRDSSIRLTLDTNIRYREDRLHLDAGDDGERLDLGGDLLMELKVQDAIPLELTRIMTELRIFPNSFSKYGAIYKSLNANTSNATPNTSPIRRPQIVVSDAIAL